MSFFCSICPRKCNVEKVSDAASGFCCSPLLPTVSRAAPHYGEEPCISGTKGSGAIFFTGCNLRCIYCQNQEISRGNCGQSVSVQELRDIMLRLRDRGVHNINLVTPSHFSLQIAEALSGIELGIPVVWNSSGYESIETLRQLEGLVQVYMPDMKYMKREPAKKYSLAPDYPDVASAAIREMYRQRGPAVFDNEGILQSGVLIRHLVLPDNELNSMDVIDFVAENFPGGSVVFSLMGQYTPVDGVEKFPELTRRIDSETYDMLCSYTEKMGIYPGYFQELDSATTDMIPDFDLTGIK